MAEDPDKTPDASEERINAARRRLLRNVVYVPPVVIGIVSLTQGCAPGSCTPTNCTPSQQCRPNQCRPNASDVRLKRDIARISGALALLDRL